MAKTNYKIECNECGRTFRPKLRTGGLDLDGRQHLCYYLGCPKCGAEFFSYAEPVEVAQKRQKLNKIRELMRKTKAKKHEFAFYKLQEEIKRDVQEATKAVKAMLESETPQQPGK